MKLLFVDCCISQRGRDSRTKALCDAFLDAYRKNHPQDSVEVVTVRSMTLPAMTRALLNQRDALIEEKTYSDSCFALAWQFAKADRIVVGAPFWDLSFPAQLRIYIEHISAVGVTYHYDGSGCHGDCKATRLAYLTSGGDVERADSLGVAYWRQLCAMFGIARFDHVFAGGLDQNPAKAPALMQRACREAAELGANF